jgi:hypothetical protein
LDESLQSVKGVSPLNDLDENPQNDFHHLYCRQNEIQSVHQSHNDRHHRHQSGYYLHSHRLSGFQIDHRQTDCRYQS